MSDVESEDFDDERSKLGVRDNNLLVNKDTV